MFVLIDRTNADNPRVYALDGDEALIGRGPTAKVRLEGANISRRHARIFRGQASCFVEDLGSSNGTYLNGRRISGPSALRPGDLLKVGIHTLAFEAHEHDTGANLTVQRRTVASPANDELYRDHAARRLKAVLQLAYDLSNTLDIEVLLKRFVDQIGHLFPNAERVAVLFFENGEPQIRVARDFRPVPGAEPLFSRSVLKQVTHEGIGVLAENTLTLDPQMTLNAAGVRSLLCVPLRAHGAPAFGAVQLDRFQPLSPFTQDDLNLLTAIAIQITMSLENARMHQSLLAQERMARDLALAHEIQLAFLPKGVPTVGCGALDIFAELTPAQEVSGDFYDMIALDDDRVALLVADVSGKGMPAALFMSMVRAVLRQMATRPAANPAEILKALNQKIIPDNPKFMFVTVVLCIYAPSSGECRVARAGHPAPILLARNHPARELPSSSGSLLGLDETIRLEEQRLTLNSGDVLLLYSDGVTEACAYGNAGMFGVDRLLETVGSLKPAAPLTDYARSVREAVQQFCSPHHPEDDITLLFLRHK